MYAHLLFFKKKKTKKENKKKNKTRKNEVRLLGILTYVGIDTSIPPGTLNVFLGATS